MIGKEPRKGFNMEEHDNGDLVVIAEINKFLAEGSVTLNGEPIAEDEIPNWLGRRPLQAGSDWLVLTGVVGGSMVQSGRAANLHSLNKTDMWQKNAPLTEVHRRWDKPAAGRKSRRNK